MLPRLHVVDPSYSFGYFGVLKKAAVSYDCEVLFASLSGVLISDCHGNAPSSFCGTCAFVGLSEHSIYNMADVTAVDEGKLSKK